MTRWPAATPEIVATAVGFALIGLLVLTVRGLVPMPVVFTAAIAAGLLVGRLRRGRRDRR